MKRTVLIGAVVLVLTLSWSMECAEGIAVNQEGFYVIAVKKRNYAPVEKTGQTTSYATGDDGDLEKGIAWPNPRFTDNGDGTVTDNLTGLIWLKNANCFELPNWADALSYCANLASGSCGLTDNSVAGDWRLPNIKELQSLIHYGFYKPALPNTAGTGQWAEGDPFTSVRSYAYWSSSTYVDKTSQALVVWLEHGLGYLYDKSLNFYVWPVRDGN